VAESGDTPPDEPQRIGRGTGALLLATTSVIATLALLLVAELAARIALSARVAAPSEIAGDTVSRTLAHLAVNPAPVVEDPDLLWSNDPGARRTQPVNPRPFGLEPVWTAEINSEGFRGAERAAGLSGAPYRILCVGDSITFGFGVEQDASWPEQLARRLAERYPQRSFEVINAGVPGWSWLQGLRFVQLRGMALDPDLIVVGHGTNDQVFPAIVTDEERLSSLGSPFERAVRRVLGRLSRTSVYRLLGSFREPAPAEPSPGCARQIAERGSCHRVAVDQIATAVEKLAEIVRRDGAELVVINTDFLATPAVTASRAASQRLGVAFEDLVTEIAERRRADEDERAARLALAPAVRRKRREEAKPGGTPLRIIVRVLVPDPSRGYTVEATDAFSGRKLRAAARDDGLGGDETAGDSVFSATLDIPPVSLAIEYRYLQDGVLEFTPLPPIESTLGGRMLALGEPGYAPVDVFADALFMVERAHPNARGHEVIAELVERRLGEFPAFREAK